MNNPHDAFEKILRNRIIAAGGSRTAPTRNHLSAGAIVKWRASYFM